MNNSTVKKKDPKALAEALRKNLLQRKVQQAHRQVPKVQPKDKE